MIRDYTLSQMIEKLSTHFRGMGYETKDFSTRLYNVRIPLNCFLKGKGKSTKIKEEIVVDIITEAHISIDTYLPNTKFGGPTVKAASSVKFFQYYLPKAKVFWAFAQYVEKDKAFGEFKKACEDNGIGLLEVSDDNVQLIQDSVPLTEILGNLVKKKIGEAESNDLDLVATLSKIISDHQNDYIHYLVYYGEPRFTRRAITGREDDLAMFLSMLLINKLAEVHNIAYAEELKNFTATYRHESDNDHQIALKLITSLWKSRFNVDYPDIHNDFEVVLMLDPNYRDHFLHQFQVFLLGSLIIDTLYKESWVRIFNAKTGSKIEDAWLAASTYHDYNYPVERWDGWMNRFLEQNFHISDSSRKRHIDHDDIGKDIVQIHLGNIIIREEFVAKMNRLSIALGCDYDDDFQRFVLHRVAVDKNHAVLGAFTFLEKFQKDSNLSDNAIDLAAASIFLHDEQNWQCFRGSSKGLKACSRRDDLVFEEKAFCKKKVLPCLELNSKPLFYLLAFCDVAQEWGRKGRNFEVEKPRLEDVQIDKKEILVHISVEDDDSFESKEKEIVSLGRYLINDRFKIKITSRCGKRNSTTDMSGT